MKLRTLAIAVAMASVSAAQADVTISGDVGLAYKSATETIASHGSEVNFDASEKVGGITYAGHLGLQYGNSNALDYGDDGAIGGTDDDADSHGGAVLNEARIDISGGFGKVRLGHQGDNGCATAAVGGDYMEFANHGIGGCGGSASYGVGYSNTFGKATVAVSHIPGGVGGTDENSIGIMGGVGPVTASLGYEDVNENLVFGLQGSLAGAEVRFRYNKEDGMDAVHGVAAKYAMGSNAIYGGIQTSDAATGNDKSFSVGYSRALGSKTTAYGEYHDSGVAGADAITALGLIHTF